MLSGFVWSCGVEYPHQGLTDIESIIDKRKAPREALARLEEIDRSRLSTADRHYYDLLLIKAHDKAYDDHDSDSLICDVIAWYDEHRYDPRYAEALYYGGRVCSDLGDFPRALKYYEEALDRLPEGTNISLKSAVLSQLGRLLKKLRLRNEAIPYLEESINLGIELGDTTNLVYDYQLLSAVYRSIKDYENADRYLALSWDHSKHLPDSIRAIIQGDRAVLKYIEKDNDSALILIRSVIERIPRYPQVGRDYFMAYASEIYQQAGILDTARIYALASIRSENLSYKISGYKTMLSPELISFIPKDSIIIYVNEYSRAVDASRNENAMMAGVIQNTLYNYSHYHNRNEELNDENSRLYGRVVVLVLLLGALSVSVWYMTLLYRRYRNALGNKSREAEAMEADSMEKKSRLATLEQTLAELEGELDRYRTEYVRISYSGTEEDRDAQISATIDRLKTHVSDARRTINDGATTDGYRMLRSALEEGRVLGDADPAWQSVRESVDAISPGFHDALTALSGGRLRREDYQLACLIRLGINSADSSRLLGLVKSAISYRRRQLCKRVFGDRITPSELDDLLRII